MPKTLDSTVCVKVDRKQRLAALSADFVINGDYATCRYCKKTIKMGGSFSGVDYHVTYSCRELKRDGGIRNRSHFVAPNASGSASASSTFSAANSSKPHQRQYLSFRPERRPSAKLLETLGLVQGATTEEVKRAFRRLALQHHPDRCGEDPKAKERWDAIRFAYDVLVDPARANAYDRNQLELYDNHQTQLAQRQLATEEAVNTTHQLKLRVAGANEKASAWLKQLAADSHGPNASPPLDSAFLESVLAEGDMKFQQGQFQEAIASFSKATTMPHPQLLRALTSRTRAYLKCGLVDDALVDAYACIHLDKNRPESYEALRMCFAHLGVPPLLKEVEDRIQTLKMEVIRQRLMQTSGVKQPLKTVEPASLVELMAKSSSAPSTAPKDAADGHGARRGQASAADEIVIDSDSEQPENDCGAKAKQPSPTSAPEGTSSAIPTSGLPTSSPSSTASVAPSPAEVLANLFKAIHPPQQGTPAPTQPSLSNAPPASSSSSSTSSSSSASVKTSESIPNPSKPFNSLFSNASEGVSWAPSSFFSEGGPASSSSASGSSDNQDAVKADSGPSHRKARHPPIPHKPTNARLRVLEQCREILWEELDQRTCGTVQNFAKLRRVTSEYKDLHSHLTEPRYLVNGGPTTLLDRINSEFEEIERACFSRIFREYKRRLPSPEGVMRESIEIEDDVTEKENLPIGTSPTNEKDPGTPTTKKRRYKASGDKKS